MANFSSGCVLVHHSVPLARIVVSPDSLDAAFGAMQELRTGIAKSTGARLHVDYSELKSHCLEPFRQTPVTVKFEILNGVDISVGKDGFSVRIAKNSIVFAANGKSGFDNAVYDFLTRYCGFVWLWPGSDGEVYDTNITLAVPIGEFVVKPDFQTRRLMFTDMEPSASPKWLQKEVHMLPDETTMEQVRLWCKRNHLGGLKVKTGHTWGEWINPDMYGKSHPEYFAEIDGTCQFSIESWNGKHGGQLCTSNPGVLNLVVDAVRRTFDSYPEYDVISISPNDGLGFCECDECIATDVKYGNSLPEIRKNGISLDNVFKDDIDQTVGSGRITGPITDRIFSFANHIGKAIAKSHPDKQLLLLVYSAYNQPPKIVRLAPNIIAQYCMQCHRHWNEQIKRTDYRNLKELACNSTQMGIYEYFDQGNWPGIIRIFPDLIADSVRQLHHLGARHYMPQSGTGFATNGFNLWFLAKVLWNVNSNVDDMMAVYCGKAFGAASDIIQEYFLLWRRQWQEYEKACIETKTDKNLIEPLDGVLSPFDRIGQLYSAELLDKAAQMLMAAKSCVDQLSAEWRRIDFIAKGLMVTRLAVDAARASDELARQGWPMWYMEVTKEKIYNLGLLTEVLTKTQQTLDLWNHWEAYIESVRNEFVLSHFWVRYCIDSRRNLQPCYALNRIITIIGEMLLLEVNETEKNKKTDESMSM